MTFGFGGLGGISGASGWVTGSKEQAKQQHRKLKAILAHGSGTANRISSRGK
jgi:hypothetical protein